MERRMENEDLEAAGGEDGPGAKEIRPYHYGKSPADILSLAELREDLIPKIHEILGIPVALLKERKPEPLDTHTFVKIANMLMLRSLRPEDISVVLPSTDFGLLLVDLSRNGRADLHGKARIRVSGVEVLCGDKDTRICIHPRVPLGKADREALAVEILRCLGRYRVGKLPEGAGGDRVSASAEPVGKVGVTASPASGDNRDAHLTAEQAKELKIKTAKAAIAAYARDKKLPSAEQLAAFRELDDARSVNKNPVRRKSLMEIANEALRRIGEVDGDCDGLASEALSSAADEIWFAQSSGPYRDFVGAATQQLTEMID
jgi:hypothetical protein